MNPDCLQNTPFQFVTVRDKNGLLNNVFVNMSYSLYCRKKQSEHLCQSVPQHLPPNRILWWTAPTLIKTVRDSSLVLLLSTETIIMLRGIMYKMTQVRHRKPVQNYMISPQIQCRTAERALYFQNENIMFVLLEQVCIKSDS